VLERLLDLKFVIPYHFCDNLYEIQIDIKSHNTIQQKNIVA